MVNRIQKKGVALKVILGIFIMSSFSIANAQLVEPNKEVGIRVSDLNSFGAIYKTRKKQDIYQRLRVAVANVNYSHQNDDDYFSGSASISLGIEKRYGINDRLKFIHGLEPYLGVQYNSSPYANLLLVSPGLGYVLGLQYDLKGSFYVNIETIPSIGGTFAIDYEGLQDDYFLSAKLNLTRVAVTVAHQFQSSRK